MFLCTLNNPQVSANAISIATFQSTYDLSLPPVEGCLIAIINFYHRGLTSLKYPSLSILSPNILVSNSVVFQEVRNKSSNQPWLVQLRPSSPLCQIYIFVEPLNSTYLQGHSISRVAFHPSSIFLVLLHKKLESDWTTFLNNWDHATFNYLIYMRPQFTSCFRPQATNLWKLSTFSCTAIQPLAMFSCPHLQYLWDSIPLANMA